MSGNMSGDEAPAEASSSQQGVAPSCKPRLPRGVRLKLDETRGEWLLLAPERVIKADAIAVEVLKRCDGIATFDAIVDDLAAAFAADRGRVATDVRALLDELAAKRMMDL